MGGTKSGKPSSLGGAGGLRAQQGVRGHAAGQEQAPRPLFRGRAAQAADQRGHHRALERGHQVAHVRRHVGAVLPPAGCPRAGRGSSTAVLMPLNEKSSLPSFIRAMRELHRAVVGAAGQAVDDRAARDSPAPAASRPCRTPRPPRRRACARPAGTRPRAGIWNRLVWPAGDDERERGQRQVAVGQERRLEVAGDVVDGHERLAVHERDRPWPPARRRAASRSGRARRSRPPRRGRAKPSAGVGHGLPTRPAQCSRCGAGKPARAPRRRRARGSRPASRRRSRGCAGRPRPPRPRSRRRRSRWPRIFTASRRASARRLSA